MAKLRHLAILVPDAEASASFFVEAFDLSRVAEARGVIYLSDGTVNVAIIQIDREDEKTGLAHFGMWVDDLAEAKRKVLLAGATLLDTGPATPGTFHEVKYRDANGIVFDLSQKGWAGAEKDVRPVPAPLG
jgi:methylmalonyl-CoA/ethylmalonyl-CoA epimerase